MAYPRRDLLTGNLESRRSLEIPESAYAVGKPYVKLGLDELEVKLVGFVHKGVRYLLTGKELAAAAR